MDRRDFLKLAGVSAIGIGAVPAAALEAPKVATENFSFGLQTLDAETGGMRPGELCIVFGSERSGKSAFCRTVRAANFPDYHAEYNGNDEFHLPIPGSKILTDCDQLYMTKKMLIRGKTYPASYLYCDMDVQLDGVDWEAARRYTRELKKLALDSEKAIIWTIGFKRNLARNEPRPIDIVDKCGLLSPIMNADYAVLCTKDWKDHRSNVFLFKNRYGKAVGTRVEFVDNRRNLPIMREACEQKDPSNSQP